MLNNNLTHKHGQTIPAGLSRRAFLARFTVLFTATSILGTLAQDFSTPSLTSGTYLKPGDIIYVDSGDAIRGGYVIKVDPITGQKAVIASGGYLRLPLGVVIDANGHIIVSDSGRLICITPETGEQTLLADNSSGTLGYPCGLAMDRHGDVLCANLTGIIAADPASGALLGIAGCGNLPNAISVAVAENGDLIVLLRAYPARILRVNPHSGKQTQICQGGYLNAPQALAIHSHDIYVTDVATSDGNFGIGRILHIDARTGAQTIVSEGKSLVGPVGIAVDDAGQLIVGDPNTVNPASPDLQDGGYDGAIISINPATHDQTVLTRGEGSTVNPRGVAIVPEN